MTIDKLEDIINKYNTYYITIKMKPADVKPSTYVKSNKEINYQNCKFKVGGIELEYQNIKALLRKALFLLVWRSFCDWKN